MYLLTDCISRYLTTTSTNIYSSLPKMTAAYNSSQHNPRKQVDDLPQSYNIPVRMNDKVFQDYLRSQTTSPPNDSKALSTYFLEKLQLSKTEPYKREKQYDSLHLFAIE